MKRRFGMWIGIILILIVGVSVTRMTRNFVLSNRSASSSILNMADAEAVVEDGDGILEDSVPEMQLEIRMETQELSVAISEEAAMSIVNNTENMEEEWSEIPAEPVAQSNEDAAGEISEITVETAAAVVAKNEPVAGMTGGPGSEMYDTAPAALEPVGPGGVTEPVEDRKVMSRKPEAVYHETKPERIKSPLDPLVEPETVNEEVPEKITVLTAEDFFERFRVAEESSVKIWEKITADNLIASNAAAEQERVLWDYELNLIYGEIRSRMSAEEAEKLKHMELEWLKERDQYAEKIAAKSSGMNVQKQDPAYIRALAEKTKERCYWLVAAYEHLLNPEITDEKTK